MTTRTEKLTVKCNDIYAKHKSEIDSLDRHGPLGGQNAAGIPGWCNHGNGTITRACNMSNMPVLPYWSGSLPTPSSAIPLCAMAELLTGYKDIFSAI